MAEKGGDLELGIDAAALDLDAYCRSGDSVSVQGACLTVTRKDGTAFYADVSRETMAKTTLGTLSAGSRVNLEPSLRAGDALGGHCGERACRCGGQARRRWFKMRVHGGWSSNCRRR